jgi:hypothetical protein
MCQPQSEAPAKLFCSSSVPPLAWHRAVSAGSRCEYRFHPSRLRAVQTIFFLATKELNSHTVEISLPPSGTIGAWIDLTNSWSSLRSSTLAVWPGLQNGCADRLLP